MKKMLASEDIVLVTEVRRSVVLENEYGIAEMKERVETTSFTVERLAPIASDVDGAERENVAGAYRRTGALVVVEAKHFDFQVLVNGEETTPEGTTLRLDTFALQVVRDDDIEIEGRRRLRIILVFERRGRGARDGEDEAKKNRFQISPRAQHTPTASIRRARGAARWSGTTRRSRRGNPITARPSCCAAATAVYSGTCSASRRPPSPETRTAFAAGGDGCPWTCERCRVYAKGGHPRGRARAV